MKDTPLSNSERDFLLKAIEEKKVRCAQLSSSEEGDAEVHRGMQIEISPISSCSAWMDGRPTTTGGLRSRLGLTTAAALLSSEKQGESAVSSHVFGIFLSSMFNF